MQNDINLHCCCFTGHRPEKLKYSEEEIKPLLADAIDRAIADGYTTFITGMAPGTDIWAAELVLEKKKQNDELCLICAVPHPGFGRRKSARETERYSSIIRRADRILTICSRYSSACYRRRNKFMVDMSSLVIAVWSGVPSGTKNTIDYAAQKGVHTVNVLDGVCI